MKALRAASERAALVLAFIAITCWDLGAWWWHCLRELVVGSVETVRENVGIARAMLANERAREKERRRWMR